MCGWDRCGLYNEQKLRVERWWPREALFAKNTQRLAKNKATWLAFSEEFSRIGRIFFHTIQLYLHQGYLCEGARLSFVKVSNTNIHFFLGTLICLTFSKLYITQEILRFQLAKLAKNQILLLVLFANCQEFTAIPSKLSLEKRALKVWEQRPPRSFSILPFLSAQGPFRQRA